MHLILKGAGWQEITREKFDCNLLAIRIEVTTDLCIARNNYNWY